MNLVNKKVALLILDGWGIGQSSDNNAIHLAKTPFIDYLVSSSPNSQLLTHGEHVGLPSGQMGNSEVGHINIGAGRVVFQELQRIHNAITSGELAENKTLTKLIDYQKQHNSKVHLMGLVSDGGVHSHIDHFKGLVTILHQAGIEHVNIHAFTDGRDTDPQGGANYIQELEEHVKEYNAEIVSVIGRYYAMDRDKRWERTKLAYDLLTKGKGEQSTNLIQSITESYAKNVTDEFLPPIVKVSNEGTPIATIEPNDIVVFVNFRTDRPRQLTEVLTQRAFSEHSMKPLDLEFYTMTNYDKQYKGINILFEKDNIKHTLGEMISLAGKTQIRIAETEKYPHVTFFFNGGREVEFEGEKRILVNSPKVATYDLQPQMSALEITNSIIPELQKGETDFICLNFANADMVGHTGSIPAAIIACETVDDCVQKIVETGLANDYHFLITADHGNSDFMKNADGSPNTAHTTNPVPLFYVSNHAEHVTIANGKLADLAPTILELLGLEKPEAMTGENLLCKY